MKKNRLYEKKKTITYLERSEEALNLKREKLALYRPSQRIYIDESGIDRNESYPYGWSQLGERFVGSRPGKRQKRLSMIGALCQGKFLAPLVYQGYCTARFIEAWVENFLLPEVEPGQVIIMDNAAVHKSNTIRELIEKAGCELLFLPTYSPDLNP